jgi:YVTN family beta-propeller protein
MVMDGASNSIVAEVSMETLDMGDLDIHFIPCALVYNRVNNRIYCANYWGDFVTVIDAKGDSAIATIRVGERPLDLVCSADGSKVYCANFGGSSISVIACSRSTWLK